MFVSDKRDGTEQCERTKETGQTDRYISSALQIETQIDGVATTLITKLKQRDVFVLRIGDITLHKKIGFYQQNYLFRFMIYYTSSLESPT